MKLTEEKILSMMRNKVARPMKVAELSRELGLPETQKREFRSFIKDMAGAGTLIKIRGGRYGLPDEMNLVTVKLHVLPNVFGLVSPDHHHG